MAHLVAVVSQLSNLLAQVRDAAECNVAIDVGDGGGSDLDDDPPGEAQRATCGHGVVHAARLGRGKKGVSGGARLSASSRRVAPRSLATVPAAPRVQTFLDRRRRG